MNCLFKAAPFFVINTPNHLSVVCHSVQHPRTQTKKEYFYPLFGHLFAKSNQTEEQFPSPPSQGYIETTRWTRIIRCHPKSKASWEVVKNRTYVTESKMANTTTRTSFSPNGPGSMRGGVRSEQWVCM